MKKAYNQQKFQPKPKQYCCLYHYVKGKQTKGITPCNTHVKLGMINPITALSKQERNKMYRKNFVNPTETNGLNLELEMQNLQVNAQEFVLNYHPHYYNDIKNKTSLPKYLVYPRVYVEKLNPKHSLTNQNNFQGYNRNNKVSFREIYQMFKKFALQTNFITEKALNDDIKQFSKQNNIKTTNITSSHFINLGQTQVPQYLFPRKDFINYLIQHQFSNQQAQEFWDFVYNQQRFTVVQRSQSNLAETKKQFVCMRAFSYNFRKFYLDQQAYYKNIFSQPALRQRLIDLRVFLEPWFTRNIFLKTNMKDWKQIQLETLDYLRKAGYEKQEGQMLKIIEERNNIWSTLRTIAKSIYDLTDQKNFGIDVWDNRITYLIQEKTDSLICFMGFSDKFKDKIIEIQLQSSQNSQQIKNNQKQKTFKLTDMIEFLNQQRDNYDQLEQKWIIKWIRAIYKYLFFYKNNTSLQIDHTTLRLSCKEQIQISQQTLTQFIQFKSNQNDKSLQILSQLSNQIHEKVQSMPELNGKKKYLAECNYLTETLSRYLKRNNFWVFEQLYSIVCLVKDHGYDFQGCHQEIISVLKGPIDFSKVDLDLCNKLWKQLFSFPIQRNQESQSIDNEGNQNYTYKDALNKYRNVKSALGIKTSNHNQLQINPSQSCNNKVIKNMSTKSANVIVNMKKNQVKAQQKIEQFDWNLSYKTHQRQCCSQGYCNLCNEVVSTQFSSTISQVEGMESYLMDLLKDF